MLRKYSCKFTTLVAKNKKTKNYTDYSTSIILIEMAGENKYQSIVYNNK